MPEEGTPPSTSWEIAGDAEEVHALLLRCDAYQATATSTPVPARNRATTQRRVESGQVHLLRHDGRAVGAVTVSADPPFELPAFMAATPTARYVSRLSVDPKELARGSLVGVQCLRRAVEVAARDRAEVLRSQANPDLRSTWQLLSLLGFEQRGPVSDAGYARHAFLEKRLAWPDGRAVTLRR